MGNNKILSVALLAILITAGGFLLLPLVSANKPIDTTENGQQVVPLFCQRDKILSWFINNGVPASLSGEASTFDGFILVLEIEGESVNVMIPGRWVIDGEMLDTEGLLDGDPFELGDTMTVKTLMVELLKDTLTVRIYLAYSIDVEGAIATALLPININSV